MVNSPYYIFSYSWHGPSNRYVIQIESYRQHVGFINKLDIKTIRRPYLFETRNQSWSGMFGRFRPSNCENWPNMRPKAKCLVSFQLRGLNWDQTQHWMICSYSNTTKLTLFILKSIKTDQNKKTTIFVLERTRYQCRMPHCNQ